MLSSKCTRYESASGRRRKEGRREGKVSRTFYKRDRAMGIEWRECKKNGRARRISVVRSREGIEG
jgi:hypothetical protein